MSSYVLAVNIGLQGTKAAVVDTDLKIIADAFEESMVLTDKPGQACLKGEDVTGAVLRTVSRVISDSGVTASDIKAVAVTGQGKSVVGIGEDGNAVGCIPAAMDTQARPFARAMETTAGKQIILITGAPAAKGIGPVILWRKTDEETYAKTARYVPIYAFAAMQMCGLTAAEAYADITWLPYSGFGDNLNKSWSKDLLGTFDICIEKMPRIVASSDIVGKISADTAKKTGLVEGTPVAAGLADTSAAIFGTDMTEVGHVEDWAGSESVLAGIVDEYKPDIEQGSVMMLRAPIDGIWYAASNVEAGGLARRWFLDTLTGLPPITYDQLEKEAADVPAGCGGITFIPGSKAGFLGLTWKATRGAMYRAILEGISYQYCKDLGTLRLLYPMLDFSTVYAATGAAQGDLFNQIKADVLGVKIQTYEASDTAILGAAAMAGVVAGAITDLTKPVAHGQKEDKTFTPSEKDHDAYCAFCMHFNAEIAALHVALDVPGN